MALTQVDQGLLGTYAQYTGFKNRIINGAMVIDQRNSGALVTMNPAAGSLFTVDRFQTGVFGSTYTTSAITLQQVIDAPNGFINSLKVASTSTITPDANKLGSFITHNIEGFNVADFGWGAAAASVITLSFFVKASKTGIMSVAFENSATDRSYLKTVSIVSANTWEQKTVTIAGDVTGTWNKTNSVGISVKFGLMSNGSWLAGTGGSWSSTRAILSTSQTNFIAASGDSVNITGVQLEKGSTATSFDYRPYGTELALCQRYYWKNSGVAEVGLGMGISVTTSAAAVVIPFPVAMRALPTFGFSNIKITDAASYDANISSASTIYTSVNTCRIQVNTPATMATYRAAMLAVQSVGSGYIDFSAEL